MKIWNSCLISVLTLLELSVSIVDPKKQFPPAKEKIGYQEKKAGYAEKAGIETTDSSALILKPWLRLVGDVKNPKTQMVQPTVIQGVTFSAEPIKETPNYPLPWVSLKKDGSPKTIKPKLKGAVTKNPSPTYDTYFHTEVITTIVHEKMQQLKHGKALTTVTEAITTHIPETFDDGPLNPLIRCTPDRYFDKRSDGPICTPWSAIEWVVGRSYFVTWYPKHFNASTARVNLAYADHAPEVIQKEILWGKGATKNDKKVDELDDTDAEEAEIELQHIDEALYSGEWVDNQLGWYPIEVLEDWLQGDEEKLIFISVQSSAESDDAVELFNGPVVRIRHAPQINKKMHKKQHLRDAEFTAAIAIPIAVSVVIVAFIAVLVISRNYTHIVPQNLRKKKTKKLSDYRSRGVHSGVMQRDYSL